MPIKTKKQLTFNQKGVISTDIKTPNPHTDDTGNKLKLGLGAPKVTRRNNLQNIHGRKKTKEHYIVNSYAASAGSLQLS